MTDIQAWIDNNRTRADRAAGHVANVAAGVERWTMKVPPTDTDTDIMLIGLLDGTLGKALNALQAVLDMHRPIWVDGIEYCKHCVDFGGEYPCPTVQAIQTELERKETQP